MIGLVKGLELKHQLLIEGSNVPFGMNSPADLWTI